jgi:hypothetical protein
MSAIQPQLTPNHQSEVLSADHREIGPRERARCAKMDRAVDLGD